MKKGLSSNSFPKTFSIKFSPVRALSVLLLIFTSCVERPVRAKFSYKVSGKGVRGDSPQCGEMSRSAGICHAVTEGRASVRGEPFLRKVFPR